MPKLCIFYLFCPKLSIYFCEQKSAVLHLLEGHDLGHTTKGWKVKIVKPSTQWESNPRPQEFCSAGLCSIAVPQPLPQKVDVTYYLSPLLSLSLVSGVRSLSSNKWDLIKPDELDEKDKLDLNSILARSYLHHHGRLKVSNEIINSLPRLTKDPTFRRKFARRRKVWKLGSPTLERNKRRGRFDELCQIVITSESNF